MTLKRKKGIVAFLLSFVMLFISLTASGIAVSAESEPALCIGYVNISLDRDTQQFKVKYAVSVSDGIKDRLQEVRMMHWHAADADGGYETSSVESGTVGWEEIDGVRHAVFDYVCDLSDLTSMIYSRAYIYVGGVKYFSNLNKYNFITYAYKKQGTADTNTVELIAAVRELGDTLTGQRLGISVDGMSEEEKISHRLPSAPWRRIRLDGAKVGDGFSWGMYLDGDIVDVKAEPEVQKLYFYDADSNEYVGNEILVKGSANYRALREPDNTPKITIADVDYYVTTNIFVRYYVLCENIESHEGISLLVWTAAPDDLLYMAGNETVRLTEYKKETVGKKEYLVFEYSGYKYTNIAEQLYARAVIGDNELLGNVSKYSILAYAYENLGRIEPEDKSNDEALLQSLEAILNMGIAMQEALEIGLDRPISGNWYRIKVENGSLPDGFDEGMYLSGDKVVLTAFEYSDRSFSHWERNSENIGGDSTIEITVGSAHDVYSAVYN